MAKKVNLIGKRFGRLTVKRYLDKEEREYRLNTWECHCDCGNLKEVSTSHLKNGNVVSCGCIKDESYVLNKMSGSPTYSSYHAMVLRCSGYDQNYTEKDRKICERWLEPNGQGFLNFLEDMGERPESTTLERSNNTLDYTPDNCIWDTKSNQAYNRDLFKNSTSGKTGVSYDKSKDSWTAYINKNKERFYLGNFSTFEEAVAARQSAEIELYSKPKE